MSQNYSYPAASTSASNPANGTPGAAAPTTATEIAGKDAGGLLQVPLVTATRALAVDGSGVTQPVSASALPLPAGASTSALQTSGNSSLSSIDTKTPALGQALAAASVPVVLTAAQLATLTPLATIAATQSGSWNIVNISGTISLPTGAATETTLAAVNTKLAGTLAVSAAALPLPSGASTSALQTTGNTSLASIDTKLTSPLVAKAGGKASANAPVRNDYTTTNVTTSAFTQLVASTTSTTTEIEIFDSSGQTLALATGAAASEVIQIYITPGGNGRVPLAIASGTRVSIKAISATASSGEIDINFYA